MYITCVAVHIHVTCTTEIYGHCMWSSAQTTEHTCMGGTYIVRVQLETVLVAIIRKYMDIVCVALHVQLKIWGALTLYVEQCMHN